MSRVPEALFIYIVRRNDVNTHAAASGGGEKEMPCYVAFMLSHRLAAGTRVEALGKRRSHSRLVNEPISVDMRCANSAAIQRGCKKKNAVRSIAS